MKAIETEYKGYRFRSRLEARWAVFFDALGIDWKYETEGYEIDTYRYLPDFYLPAFNAWVEVKGDPDGLRKEFDRLRVVLGPNSPLPGFAKGDSEVIVLGDVPEAHSCHTILHPVLSRRTGILARTWGYFAPGQAGNIWLSDSHQSYIALLFKKYAWGDMSESRESTGWDIQPWQVESNCSLTPCLDAYKAARQARFEHGVHGR